MRKSEHSCAKVIPRTFISTGL